MYFSIIKLVQLSCICPTWHEAVIFAFSWNSNSLKRSVIGKVVKFHDDYYRASTQLIYNIPLLTKQIGVLEVNHEPPTQSLSFWFFNFFLLHYFEHVLVVIHPQRSTDSLTLHLYLLHLTCFLKYILINTALNSVYYFVFLKF